MSHPAATFASRSARPKPWQCAIAAVAGGDHRAAGPVGQGVVEELLYRGINTPRLRGGRGRVLVAVPARGEREHGHEKHDEGTRTSYRVGPTHLPPFYNGTQIAPPVQSLSTNYRELRKGA